MGGHLNAYTSREQTAYYAKVLEKDVNQAVDILSDILQNSTLEVGAIERERDVILREQEEVNKQMEEVVFDHLHAIAYPESNLGRTILGPETNIRSINKGHLQSYIKSNYIGPRMVLSAAGAVDHEALVKAAEKAFSGIPGKSGLSLMMGEEKARFTGAEVRMRDDTMDTAHVVVAVEGASWTSPDYLPLLVAQAIVGSWNRGLLAAGGDGFGSRLAQIVSKYNLAQSFQSFNTAYTDTGMFGIYCVSDHTYDLDDLVYHVQQEWVRLCLSVTEGEVERAKLHLKSALLLSLDSTTAICEDIGRQVLIYGRRMSLPEIYAQIDSIDHKTVKRVASKYLYDRCPAVVGMGAIGSLPDYNRIRASTHWLRN